MATELDLQAGERVLEIGTGCGYHAAVTAELVGAENVYSVEYVPDLAERAEETLANVATTASRSTWATAARVARARALRRRLPDVCGPGVPRRSSSRFAPGSAGRTDGTGRQRLVHAVKRDDGSLETTDKGWRAVRGDAGRRTAVRHRPTAGEALAPRDSRRLILSAQRPTGWIWTTANCCCAPARETGVLDALVSSADTPAEVAETAGVTERAAELTVDALRGWGCWSRSATRWSRPTGCLGSSRRRTSVLSAPSPRTRPRRVAGGAPGDDAHGRPAGTARGRHPEPTWGARRRGRRDGPRGGHGYRPRATRRRLRARRRRRPGRHAVEFARRGFDVTMLAEQRVVDAVGPLLDHERVELVAGDPLDGADGPFDIVFHARVARDYGPGEPPAARGRPRGARGRGLAVHVDALRDGTPDAGLTAELLAGTESGEWYAAETVGEWFTDAGFEAVREGTFRGRSTDSWRDADAQFNRIRAKTVAWSSRRCGTRWSTASNTTRRLSSRPIRRAARCGRCPATSSSTRSTARTPTSRSGTETPRFSRRRRPAGSSARWRPKPATTCSSSASASATRRRCWRRSSAPRTSTRSTSTAGWCTTRGLTSRAPATRTCWWTAGTAPRGCWSTPRSTALSSRRRPSTHPPHCSTSSRPAVASCSPGTGDQTLVAVEDGETVGVHGPVAFAPLLVDGEQGSAVERNRTVREDTERAFARRSPGAAGSTTGSTGRTAAAGPRGQRCSPDGLRTPSPRAASAISAGRPLPGWDRALARFRASQCRCRRWSRSRHRPGRRYLPSRQQSHRRRGSLRRRRR